jgi:hypothetical protein
MSTTTDLPELLGRKEVAEVLGIHPENIGKVKNMPEPFARVSGGQVPVWKREQIEALLADRAARGR